jgi:hypothetical protein
VLYQEEIQNGGNGFHAGDDDNQAGSGEKEIQEGRKLYIHIHERRPPGEEMSRKGFNNFYGFTCL